MELRRYFRSLRAARARGVRVDPVKLQGGRPSRELGAADFRRLANRLDKMGIDPAWTCTRCGGGRRSAAPPGSPGLCKSCSVAQWEALGRPGGAR